MGTDDAHTLKPDAQPLLARQSRLQHNATWITSTRDRHCTTGKIQYNDFGDALKSRSVWDTIDHDSDKGVRTDDHTRNGRDSRVDEEVDIIEAMKLSHTSKSTLSSNPTASSELASQVEVRYRSMTLPKGIWCQMKSLTRTGTGDEVNQNGKFATTGLIVRLYFTRKNKESVKVILKQAARSQGLWPIVTHRTTPPISSINTPATAQTPGGVEATQILDSVESLYSFPLFKRPWVDETYDFNVAHVWANIRPIGEVRHDLGKNYHWYVDAASVDAIFPPGVPISATEISAFYPHHVRWKDVMVRLTNNDYRGPDIMGIQAHFRGAPDHEILPSHMNSYQRDTVKTAIPGFKTTAYKGKHDYNLRSDHFLPGPYIQNAIKGYTLPSFEDLVRGLQRFPAGIDARGLTSCLSWYLEICDTFTPKLELNVLHTRSLICALRVPHKPFGPQNLDCNALEEWRSKGTLESLDIQDKKNRQQLPAVEPARPGRSQLHLNLDKEYVSMDVTLPLRHVLTFPFLALHNVVSEAYKLGIKKTEIRQAAKREASDVSASNAKPVAEAAIEDDMGMRDIEQEDASAQVPSLQSSSQEPHRSPKRPIPVDAKKLSAHKKIKILPGPRDVPVSRRPTPRALALPAPRNAPSSSYTPLSSNRDDFHTRREFHAQQHDHYGGRSDRLPAAYNGRAPYPPEPSNDQYSRR